jgi:hypothetical protein
LRIKKVVAIFISTFLNLFNFVFHFYRFFLYFILCVSLFPPFSPLYYFWEDIWY